MFKLELSCKTNKFYPATYLNPKGEDSSCKIDGILATYISKLIFERQAWFLSQTLLILKNINNFLKCTNDKLIGVQSNHGVDYFGGPAVPTH